MRQFLVIAFLFALNTNSLHSQVNIAFAKKNTFKIIVFSEGFPIKIGSGFVYKSFKKSGKNICVGISNAHVLDRGDSIVIQFEDMSVSQIYFDFIDVEKDLISFQFETGEFKQGFFPTTQTHFKQGDEVFTMSNPRGLEYSLSKGEIASIRTEYNNEMIQFTAPASPGSSGSPLLNSKGHLVGVISSQLYGGQNLNFALSINSAKDFFNKYIQTDISTISSKKLIEKIFRYKSESSPTIKNLQEKIIENKSNAEVYSFLLANKRYVFLDNYCLTHKIRIEEEDKLYENSLESFISYNKNFNFSEWTCLQYSSVVIGLPETDKKLLLDFLDLNNVLVKDYNGEPYFLFYAAILNFKLKDYYSALSNAIKFTGYQEEFEKENSYSGIRGINYWNKICVAAAYKVIGDCYKELGNFTQVEKNYLNAIDNSILVGDWCQNSKNLIVYYFEQDQLEQFNKLCAFVKLLEKNPNYLKCDLSTLVGKVKSVCELIQ